MAITRFISLVICAATTASCARYFFYPTREYLVTPRDLQLSFEERRVKSGEKLITAWFIPSQTPKGVVLFLHGNGNNMGDHLPAVGWLPKQGYHLVTFDYQGYGSSEGTPSFEGSLADAEAMLEAIESWSETRNLPVVVFGQSIGAAFALTTAATTSRRDNIVAVVAESSFASYRKIIRDTVGSVWFLWPFQFPLSLTVSDRFSPIQTIAKIAPIPLLIIHGTKDSIVPYHHAELLFQAARSPKNLWTLEGGGHIAALSEELERQRLLNWLNERSN